MVHGWGISEWDLVVVVIVVVVVVGVGVVVLCHPYRLSPSYQVSNTIFEKGRSPSQIPVCLSLSEHKK